MTNNEQFPVKIRPEKFNENEIKQSNLPLVRIDEQDRAMLQAVLKRYNMTYSAFARGCIKQAYSDLKNK